MAKDKEILCSIVTTLYKGEKFLDRFLQDVTEQTVFPNVELVLVHNTPTPKELEIVNKWKPHGFIKHVVVDQLESWGASINRAVQNASGELIALWNVDDLRTSTSLEAQIEAMDDKEYGVVHGDFIVSREFGKKDGEYINHANYEHEHTRGMVLGPFFMWRKSLHDTLGYMDEQFKSGADFCFAIRLGATTKIKHLPRILGYYLDEGQGLSTKGDDVQPIERTVVELRYGIIDKIEKHWLTPAFKYDIRRILQGDTWTHVESFVPNYEQFLRQNEK